MRVRFRELGDGRLIVYARIRYFERAFAGVRIRLDVSDTRNFGQIASDRGGTGTSVHIRHFKVNQHGVRAFRSRRVWRYRSRRRGGNGLIFDGTTDEACHSQQTQRYRSFH